MASFGGDGILSTVSFKTNGSGFDFREEENLNEFNYRSADNSDTPGDSNGPRKLGYLHDDSENPEDAMELNSGDAAEHTYDATRFEYSHHRVQFKIRSTGFSGNPHGSRAIPLGSFNMILGAISAVLESNKYVSPIVDIHSMAVNSLNRAVQCILPVPLKSLPPGDLELVARKSTDNSSECLLGYRPINWDFPNITGLYCVANDLGMVDVRDMVADYWWAVSQHPNADPYASGPMTDASKLFQNGFVEKLDEKLPIPSRSVHHILCFRPGDFARMWLSADNKMKNFFAGIFARKDDIAHMTFETFNEKSGWLTEMIGKLVERIRRDGHLLRDASDDPQKFCDTFHMHPWSQECYRPRLEDPVFDDNYLKETKDMLVRSLSVWKNIEGRTINPKDRKIKNWQTELEKTQNQQTKDGQAEEAAEEKTYQKFLEYLDEEKARRHTPVYGTHEEHLLDAGDLSDDDQEGHVRDREDLKAGQDLLKMASRV